MITKKDIINDITKMLKCKREEIGVTNFPNLRQPNRGFHPYCIRYDETADTALVYPWSGADEGWEIPVKNITLGELKVLRDYIYFFVTL